QYHEGAGQEGAGGCRAPRRRREPTSAPRLRHYPLATTWTGHPLPRRVMVRRLALCRHLLDGTSSPGGRAAMAAARSSSARRTSSAVTSTCAVAAVTSPASILATSTSTRTHAAGSRTF